VRENGRGYNELKFFKVILSFNSLTVVF